MISEEEVFDMAVRTALKTCDATALATVSCIQQLIIDVYGRGRSDAFAIAKRVIATEPFEVPEHV